MNTKERYAKKVTEGVCTHNGCHQPPASNRRRCYEHLAIRVQETTQSRNARVEKGICVNCTLPATHGQLCETHRLLVRRMGLRLTYKLTEVEFQALETRAGGRCMICQEETRLTIDHDHDTGSIRGLICYPCNTALGHLERLTQFQEQIQEYLQENE